MKRFASHYVYTPSLGFLKQHVVEINDEGHAVSLYRLEEEIESIIWTPGVIRLVPDGSLPDQLLIFEKPEIRTDSIDFKNLKSLKLTAIRLYPFNFSEMKATTDTIVQLLDNSVF